VRLDPALIDQPVQHLGRSIGGVADQLGRIEMTLLASGFSAITPCHQTPDQMRQHPIGTGPFKFVEFKPNEYIKLTRNPDYWKPDRPYLDAIDFIIIRDPATAVLAFIAGKFDVAGPFSPPLVKDIMSQLPDSICDEAPAQLTVT
jgi:peptide/nickel transport system substrate-binding protein